MTQFSSQKPPFFIVGCGRSGTTLVRSMLDAHPEVGVPLESLFIIDYLLSARPLATLKQWLPREYELYEWGIDVAAADLDDCQSPAELISRVHELYLQDQGKNRWGQKTPRFVRYGPLLKRHFPEARFIHMLRDPRAVASSLARSPVHQSTIFHGARRWRDDVTAGLALENSFGDDVLRVYYEDLVARPEGEIRRICRFLDLEFVPDMLQFHRQAPSDYGDYYRQVHASLSKPVSQASVDRWRDKLSPGEIALIEEVAGPLLKPAGYTPAREAGRGVTPLYRLRVRAGRVPGLFRQLWHYLRYRSGYLFCVIRRKLVLRTLNSPPVNR